MARLLLDRDLADILRLAESLKEADPLQLYAGLHRINSIVGRALQEAELELELEQAEREVGK